MGVRFYVGSAAAAWVGVLAAIGLGHRTSDAPPQSAAPRLADAGPVRGPAAVASGSRWSVKIDGWTIQMDDVSKQAIPELEPEFVPPVLSPYDQMIARYAAAAGLDWRFVSAVIYEESRFEPASRSPAGAVGLMQVMPAAAQDVGEVRFHEPEENVRTGVRYLQRLWREYAKAAERDRLALMLAAYNMGMGHVRDAQGLARRFGYDPLRWDGAMDVMVGLLEEPQIAVDMRYGFAQGRSVVGYVDRVLTRYASYRRTLPAVMPASL
jgi:soluble lytic murein transglycosylase-like protein